ncbi:MAG: hypothetical protein AAGD25_06340 [Cyanobacteria bacterium P01_F01_bin.150]
MIDAAQRKHRLSGLRGKAWVREMLRVEEELEQPIRDMVSRIAELEGKLTYTHIGAIAVHFDLPLKTTLEYLAGYKIILWFSVRRLLDSKLTASEVLTAEQEWLEANQQSLEEVRGKEEVKA